MKRTLFQANEIEASEATSDDGPALQSLFEECADFIELTTGLPPAPAEVQSLFTALPEGKTYDDKVVIRLLSKTDGLVGVMDVVRDYPELEAWWLGLMLLRPDLRKLGRGNLVIRSFMEWAAANGAKWIYLAVVAQNVGARRFWDRMGFDTVETRPPARIGARVSVVIVMRCMTPSLRGA